MGVAGSPIEGYQSRKYHKLGRLKCRFICNSTLMISMNISETVVGSVDEGIE